MAQSIEAHTAPATERRTPSFDAAEAVRKLYGPYGKDEAVANAAVPKDKHLDLEGSQFNPGDLLVVRPFWSRTYKDAGELRAVLLTYAVPFEPNWKPIVPGDEPFSCHACTPLIGVAIFEWTGTAWAPEVTRVAVNRGGAWGLPPSPVRLMRVGPHKMAVELDDDYEGGGVTTRNEQIIPFDESMISDALLVEIGENNEGECERRRPSDEPPCYRYRKVLSVRPGPNPEYYDIYAILHGTDYDDGPSYGIHRVTGREVFRFLNGAYRRFEKHGDITQTEAAMRSGR